LDRDFKNQLSSTDVQFYVGVYKESTITKEHITLYVIGEPDIEEITRRLTQYSDDFDITHIVFGAAHSFKVSTYEDFEEWLPAIQHFLTLDYWCTLELDISLVNFIHETDVCSWSRFIPMISVKLPYIRDLGYNAVIKIDDVDFNYSNHGVWCHLVHDLTNYDSFTSWDAYKDDFVIKEKTNADN
jgi:hypothetical protein